MLRRRLCCLLVLVAACSSGTPVARPTAAPTAPAASRPAASPTAPPSPSAPAGPAGCTSYAPPDPRRPVLRADVTVSGRHVTGTEQLLFTPDLPVSEVVLRLWAAAPVPARRGSAQRVTSVRVDGAARAFRQPSATVVRVPWSGAAGRTMTLDVGFVLTLPVGADERWGSRGTTSWFASGLPRLPWEPGRGWDVEPPTTQFAEASTSGEMRLASLTVHHAAGLTVLATGRTVQRTSTSLTTTAAAVRDVSVAVGAFRTATAAGPVPVTVGVAPGLPDSPAALAREAETHLRAHAARFGPFPYEQLAIAVLPDVSGGIEYPGAILLGTRQDRDATLSHELGHEWFYGLVGDDQARDPWLDEGFATYAEAIDRGTASSYTSARLPAAVQGTTGRPMTYWEGRTGYYLGVYVQGAAALLRARSRAPARFDAQLRCYVAHEAHRIATPADVARELPLAVPELRRVGALPR